MMASMIMSPYIAFHHIERKIVAPFMLLRRTLL
jgi:hypothetical protein